MEPINLLMEELETKSAKSQESQMQKSQTFQWICAPFLNMEHVKRFNFCPQISQHLARFSGTFSYKILLLAIMRRFFLLSINSFKCWYFDWDLNELIFIVFFIWFFFTLSLLVEIVTQHTELFIVIKRTVACSMEWW